MQGPPVQINGSRAAYSKVETEHVPPSTLGRPPIATHLASSPALFLFFTPVNNQATIVTLTAVACAFDLHPFYKTMIETLYGARIP